MESNVLLRLPGSFRDPAGSIYISGDRVFRTVSQTAAPQYETAREVLRSLVAQGRLADFEERPVDGFEDAAYLLEHPKISPWTLPYEWSFSLLKEAALFHLDLHLYLLERGFTLSDASAYNVQFIGPRPVFIDHLSIRPYVEGEFWAGHRQFCEQFLNPLLLRAYFDIAANGWYRGELEGIPTAAIAKLLPLRSRLSWRAMTHVILPAYFQQGATSDREVNAALKNRKLPLEGFRGLLRQLFRWIEALRPANISATTWANYASTTTYDPAEAAQKGTFVGEFIAETRPRTVIDLGCNTGDYSSIALERGADTVIGFDFDQQSLDQAFQRAKAGNLNFLPLFLDARNPSPSQGWMQSERLGFSERYSSDAVLALAFEHHLAIAHNVPLDQVVEWIVSLAPTGVIEFVPKSDPTITKMLAFREDIFPNYNEAHFRATLEKRSHTVRQKRISRSGRTLFWYSR
ncbi:class I SAM-dependent methyltransferase [Chelativorans sp.]|uniref:class I SAM-dependent methyltransferase n=1 Tax=Chelativorans sp. TaxID=2203393 RepID=UPI002810EFD1|nr:class I SAM-dependent methyltransferase [Chelativorans sp.]